MSDIRLLRSSDIPSAMRLVEAAGWNQLPEDWARLLELEPEGCFGIEADGVLAATATSVCFGRSLSWIGMVLTHPDHRRRGYGRLLMEHSLEFLENRKIDWIKLDATDMGRPLYERLGFVDECSIERWAAVAPSSVGPPASIPAGGIQPWVLDAALDRAAFGADRTAILAHLARDEAAAIPDRGHAMGRPGANAVSFAPCVARSPDAVRILLEWFLSRHPGETVYWDLLPENREAVRLANEFGFERRRKLVRMVRPGVRSAAPLRVDNSLVYATAGFEYG